MKQSKETETAIELVKKTKLFLDDLDSKIFPDVTQKDLLEEIRRCCREAVYPLIEKRFEVTRAWYENLSNCNSIDAEAISKLEHPMDIVSGKLKSYGDLAEMVDNAEVFLENGRGSEAIQLAALAGAFLPLGRNDSLQLAKVVKMNLDSGRVDGTDSRKKSAMQKLERGKIIIDEWIKNKLGFMSMPRKKIYFELGERIGWGAKHTERMLGKYLEEVTAKKS